MALKVLIVEDEDLIREVIVINLSRAGYEVFQAGNGEDGIETFKSVKPDVILLDINLPGIDGFEVCRRIREEAPTTGIIMLTARSQEADRIGGLKSGADDYITKPFSPAELIARIEALARRLAIVHGSGSGMEEPLVSGPFVLDVNTRELRKNGNEIDVTQVEFLILAYMMKNGGKALSRKEIFEHVWTNEEDGDTKIVDVNVRRLRMKIEDDPAIPGYIQTVWGTGYMWCSTGASQS